MDALLAVFKAGCRVKLLFFVNSPEFFLSHRLPLAIAARDVGFEVHIATSPGRGANIISDYGFMHHAIPLMRRGRNPLVEAKILLRISRLILQVRPDILHLVTVKPVIYGGLAARLSPKTFVVAAISGLGTVFVERGKKLSLMRHVLGVLYRLALGREYTHVIFQNDDDRGVLRSIGALSRASTSLIKGSGVLLEDYTFQDEPTGCPVVTFAARLLADKGVREFVGAARLLRSRGVKAQFMLVGSTDPGNLTSISDGELDAWARSGVVEVLGYREDIEDVLSHSNLVVLPSYREGLPKVLIEAAACGRAIVTTDVPGCRDAVIPNETGLLVPARDVTALADAIQTLIDDPVRRRGMGAAGRALAEREFGIERVIDAHLEIYRAAISSRC